LNVALVTGGTGFIGSHLVRLLVERGTERVVVISRQGSVKSFAGLANRVVVEQADVGVFYTILGPSPAPTAGELLQAIEARIPAARLSFAVKPDVSRLVEAIGGLAFDDRYARSEWGWRHELDLARIIESFQITKGVA
jgi:nucleoside-diphosphate-sugar epimerase